jgi:branched-chain amino acid transport system ATP-binding protein
MEKHMDAIIQTKNLTKQFGGLVAVNEVDFTLDRGEVRGLIGPNGSGKTTLINLITGVYEPTSGEVIFNDEKITGWNPNQVAQRGIMRTFQIPRLFGNMTLLENMLIPRFADFSLDYWLHYAKAVERADELMELSGIIHLRDELAKTLSGGQKAMLDEPFAGVNIVIKETIIKMIKRMAAEGVTFLLVSHEMTSIRQTCPRVTVLAEGAIIAEGSMDEIISQQHVIDAYLGG